MPVGFTKRVRRIAVLRANGLGDFIFVLPALQALRETYPEAEITYLGKKWHQEFLMQRPSPVDRVVVVPTYPGVGSDESSPVDSTGSEKFFAAMKSKRFDVALQLHGGGRNSNPFLNNIGAKLTVGLKTADAEPLDVSIPYIYYQSEVLRYLEVVAAIGAAVSDLQPKVQVMTKDLQEAAQALGKADERPLVVIHPGATDLRRRWPTERFAAVADRLVAEGFRVVFTGTGPEKQIVARIIGQMTGSCENLCGKLTLSGLTGVLAKAAVVVGNDTGPLHLAEAIGTPTVSIYWCGNLINAGPLTRLKHRPQLSWVINCPLCGEDCATVFPFSRPQSSCKHETSFVTAVSAKEVTDAALELLKTMTESREPISDNLYGHQGFFEKP